MLDTISWKNATRKLQVTYGSDTCRDMASYAAMLDRHSPSPRFDYFFPLHPFLQPLFHLANISKFMRFYLISLACTSKPTPPFLFSHSFSSLLRHTKLRFTCWRWQPSSFFHPSVFSFSPLFFSFLIFIYFLILFILIICIHNIFINIFFTFYL